MTAAEILKLDLVRIEGMEITVPEAIKAQCGIPILAKTESGYIAVVDPFLGGQQGQTITLYVNKLKVDFHTYLNPGDENKPATLKISADYLREGPNLINYTVTGGSQNIGTSDDLSAWFHREGPGGRDDQPGDGVNSQLMIKVEDAAKYGVGPELAKRGVWFYVFYPLMRAFDTILFNCNGHVIEHTVSVEEAAQTSYQNPLPILVDSAALVAAGDGTAVPFSYTVKDWIGNGPVPEPYSVSIPLLVNLKGAWFDKPVLSPQHGPDTIDLGELNGQPVIAKVHIRTPWATGDTLELICTYRNAEDKDVTFVTTKEVKAVPDFPELALDNSYLAAASGWQIWVYYKQLRNGRELGRSYSTPVMVTGNAQIELKAPFLVKPAVSPIDSLAYKSGITVRIEYLGAQAGDRARLVEVNAPIGSPQFPLVEFNSNKRVNVLLPAAFLAARHGKELELRWNLNRGGGQAGKSPVLKLSVLKIADGDVRLPTPEIEGATTELDVTTLQPSAQLIVAEWLGQAPDQNIWLRYDGFNVDGEAIFYEDRKGEPNDSASGVVRSVPIDWLKTLKNQSPLTIIFKVKFDRAPNDTAVPFPLRLYQVKSGPAVNPGDDRSVNLPDFIVAEGRPPVSLPPQATFTQVATGGKPPFTYTSEDSNVASVTSQTGTVTCRANGTTKILIRDANGTSAFYTLNISGIKTLLRNDTTFRTWPSAFEYCQAKGGRLATFNEMLAFYNFYAREGRNVAALLGWPLIQEHPHALYGAWLADGAGGSHYYFNLTGTSAHGSNVPYGLAPDGYVRPALCLIV